MWFFSKHSPLLPKEKKRFLLHNDLVELTFWYCNFHLGNIRSSGQLPYYLGGLLHKLMLFLENYNAENFQKSFFSKTENKETCEGKWGIFWNILEYFYISKFYLENK